MIKLDLSELPIAPHQYRMAGVALLGAGVIMLIIGLIFAITTPNAHGGDPVKMAADECSQHISELGLKPMTQGNKIQIIDNNIQQAVQLLAQSSQAISLCPNWSLTQYCLGSGCKPKGLSMTLQYQEPKK